MVLLYVLTVMVCFDLIKRLSETQELNLNVIRKHLQDLNLNILISHPVLSSVMCDPLFFFHDMSIQGVVLNCSRCLEHETCFYTESARYRVKRSNIVSRCKHCHWKALLGSTCTWPIKYFVSLHLSNLYLHCHLYHLVSKTTLSSS